MKPILGVLLGEAAGIGPELIAKLCAMHKFHAHCRPIVIGDRRVLEMGKRIANVNFDIAVIDQIAQASFSGPISLLDQANLDPDQICLGKIDKQSGKVTGDMLVTALTLTQKGELDGFIYAPLNKAALRYGGYLFDDEQKLFAHYLHWTEPNIEMNVLNNLWTSRVTSHIPLELVSGSLSIDKILTAIHIADGTLRRVGIPNPRIAVAAVNPHAGENGLCGRQEIEIIEPAVNIAKHEGINAVGPYPSDTIFVNAFKGIYDAVVTMYHDQGQIALKVMGFQSGVTVAAGFPYAITTPAHGTAFDIAGQGIADTGATERAVIIASRLAACNRKV
ncbi:MAG: 4-hydroxythreonine-4-phosphate dehydrogenase PdxA [Negativicutes bacterium]